MPETRASLRYLRTSPSKVREVLGLIRGREIDDARERLRFCERGPAGDVLKLLDSAVANAESNDNLPEDELFVARAYADEGPTLKRWRPRARGRGTRIRKRTSHVTIVVSRFSDDELERRRRREAAEPRRRLRRPTRRRRIRREAEPEEEVDQEVEELELEAAEEAEGVDIDEADRIDEEDLEEGEEDREEGEEDVALADVPDADVDARPLDQLERVERVEPEPVKKAPAKKKAPATKKPAKKSTTAKKPTAKKAKTTKKTTKKKDS
jgi:large subunit ribosomal protein L22